VSQSARGWQADWLRLEAKAADILIGLLVSAGLAEPLGE